MSNARQNWSNACEAALNDQIHAEQSASYVYRSIATFFARDDVALHGFSKWADESAKEELGHAQEFIDYQNKRGGRIAWKALEAPKTEWRSPLEALEDALRLEKSVNEKLFHLHKVADESSDDAFADFIENFLEEQVDAIKKLSDQITNLKRVGDGLGVYLFDKNLQ